jgi:predicted Zn-dependent peptidase
MTYTKKVLPNGLRLLTIPMPSFESATVLVMVKAGSRYETKKNSGISHFLEHMAFKGTERRPSAMDISSLIDGIGGEFNAFTGKEYTGYYIKSAKTHVGTSLDVLSDMLMHSKLDPTEIEKEKGVILEEINLYEDTPARKIGDIYEHLLYGDTPMGWDIAGEKDVIKAITREDFVNYMKSLYSADNMTVVVAGGIDEGKTEELVKKYFEAMPKFETAPYLPVVEDQKEPQVEIKHKATEQIHIAVGVRTEGLDTKDRYPLSLLSAILGGGMSSRLFHEVREKRGLAYYVRSHSEHYEDAGSLSSTAGVDPKRVTEAVQVIMAEYAKVASGSMGVSDEELKKAKEYLKGHLVLELEDSRSVSVYYAHQELLEKEKLNPDEIIKKIDAVTLDQVEAVGKKYFTNEGLNLALIGNFENKDALQSVLKL